MLRSKQSSNFYRLCCCETDPLSPLLGVSLSCWVEYGGDGPQIWRVGVNRSYISNLEWVTRGGLQIWWVYVGLASPYHKESRLRHGSHSLT
jgi:hypothetical protein